jgi:hypothetical protein
MRHMIGPVRTKPTSPAAVEIELTMNRATSRRLRVRLTAGFAAGDCKLTWAIDTPLVMEFRDAKAVSSVPMGLWMDLRERAVERRLEGA